MSRSLDVFDCPLCAALRGLQPLLASNSDRQTVRPLSLSLFERLFALRFACALSPTSGRPWQGPAAVALLALAALITSEGPRQLAKLLLLYLSLGLVADSIQVACGFLSFDRPLALPVGLLPLWFMALWANFACVARDSESSKESSKESSQRLLKTLKELKRKAFRWI